MYDSSHPAHDVLEKIGREITKDVRPKAVVVISAHWEAEGSKEGNGVEVNFGEGDGLIYELVWLFFLASIFFSMLRNITRLEGYLQWREVQLMRVHHYSFYGFPAHYYKEKYPHRGSKEIASQVATLLQSRGIPVKPVSRDVDHGVWASFKVRTYPLTLQPPSSWRRDVNKEKNCLRISSWLTKISICT